jgi:predicted lipoprotein with Yx(FWY)xxD motif
MTASKLVARVAVAVLALLAASAARADDPAVKVARKEGVGSYLTDEGGKALYVFKKDGPGKSACAATCATSWPIFYREKVAPTGGPKASDFGTITRDDGQKQTTYKGLPLYYFAGDQAPSDTKGQGVMSLWTVAAP